MLDRPADEPDEPRGSRNLPHGASIALARRIAVGNEAVEGLVAGASSGLEAA